MHQAKTQLSSLVAAVEEREEIILICRDGKPVAEIHPIRMQRDPLKQDPHLKGIIFHEDPVAPLHPDDWPGISVDW